MVNVTEWFENKASLAKYVCAKVTLTSSATTPANKPDFVDGLRDAMIRRRIRQYPDIRKITHTTGAHSTGDDASIWNTLLDQLSRFMVKKSPTGVRTYSGKSGGKNDDLAVSLILGVAYVMSLLTISDETPKGSSIHGTTTLQPTQRQLVAR